MDSNPAYALGHQPESVSLDATPVDGLIAELPDAWGSLKTRSRTLQSLALTTVPRTDARRSWVRGSEGGLRAIPPAIAVCPRFKLSL